MWQHCAEFRQPRICGEHRLEHPLSAPVIPGANHVERVALLRDGLYQIWLTMQRGLSWTRDTAQRMSRHSSSTVVSILSAFLSPLALASTPR